MPFPIPESEIVKTEAKIGIRFPEPYRKAMMAVNGGEVITAHDHWQLFPFFDTTDRKRLSRTSNDILRETIESRKWIGFPEAGWSIANNGYGDKLVFIRSASDPSKFEDTVYSFWHETGELKVLAKSFSELLKK